MMMMMMKVIIIIIIMMLLLLLLMLMLMMMLLLLMMLMLMMMQLHKVDWSAPHRADGTWSQCGVITQGHRKNLQGQATSFCVLSPLFCDFCLGWLLKAIQRQKVMSQFFWLLYFFISRDFWYKYSGKQE